MITTYYSESAGREIDFTDPGQCPYPMLKNAINKRARNLGGGTDETLDAMRAELARRPPPPIDGPSQGPRTLQRADAVPVREPGVPAPIGDNNGDDAPDPLIAGLEQRNKPLIDEIADLELDAAGLPKIVETDDDVEKITGWVVKARALFRKAEGARKVEKDDYLKGGKKVDGFFETLKTNLTGRATTLEARSAPYLKLKREREEAERLAEAARLREEQRKADEAAAEARRVEDEARRKADEAAAAIRRAEDDEARRQAEINARNAERQAQEATRQADVAAEDVRATTQQAERAERLVENGALEKTTASAGSVQLKKVGRWRMIDEAALKRSLGALGPYVADAAITAALDRAAKDETWPRVAGVHFYEEEEVKTTARRG